MKLPSGISNYETPFNMAFAESIVRDCATVCKQVPDTTDYRNTRFFAIEDCAAAILARYGLEDKEQK